MLKLLTRLFGKGEKSEKIDVPEEMPSNVRVIRGYGQAKVIWWNKKIIAWMPVGELTQRLWVLRNEIRIIDHMMAATLVPGKGCKASSTTYLLDDVGPYTKSEAAWYVENRLLVDEWWENARPQVHSVKVVKNEKEI